MYSFTKTLCNEIIPVGMTRKNIEKYIESDKKRANAYPKVKNLIDSVHKKFIEETLSSLNIDWLPLAEAIQTFQIEKSPKNRKQLETVKIAIMKEISNTFASSPFYKEIFKVDLFKKILPNVINSSSEDIDNDLNTIKIFDKFSTYFVNFNENRKNIYNWNAGNNSIAFRLVNDNFPKFIANMKLYQSLKEHHSEIISKLESSLSSKIKNIISYFEDVQSFNKVLSQKGIDTYNMIIGGYSLESGEKIQGFNELINLYKQSLSKEEATKFHGKMNMLFKQILSDHESNFIVSKFTSDKEVFDAISKFAESSFSIYENLKKLFSNCESFNLDKIFVSKKFLTNFSMEMVGRWNYINNAFEEKKIKSQNTYSLKFINDIYNSYAQDNNFAPIDIESFFSINAKIAATSSFLLKIDFDKVLNLRNDKNNIEAIKNYLDSVQDLYHYLRLIDYQGDEERDTDFYSQYDSIINGISEITVLYNKVRNYILKKDEMNKKFKMNFDCPKLLGGWDVNVETSKNSVLFKKDGELYLGLFNPKNKPVLNINFEVDGKSCYEKMLYKLIPSPSKTMFHVFVSTLKNREKYGFTEEMARDYELKTYNKGDNFNPEALYRFIDFFKRGLKEHPCYSMYNFNFLDTKDYNDLQEFFDDVARDGYSIEFKKIPEDYINSLVNEGKLYLFKIYNKDFSKFSYGQKNLHTLFLLNLFSEENLKKKCLRLNGNAEVFYRPALIDKDSTTIHEKGSVLLNKNTISGEPIANDIYQEIYNKLNNKLDGKLSDKAQELFDSGEIKFKVARHSIIKNNRYTREAFYFHFPIQINGGTKKTKGKVFNEKTLEYLKDNKDIKILGIDRGERNLLYVTLINQKGEIECQKTLNVVEQNGNNIKHFVDYHKKLQIRELERDRARKNWQSIDDIKNLKEGYLSAAVYEVSKMLIENNAILIMEDLDSNFKNSRVAIEKQVYQKFEKMLLTKLNYFVFKDRSPNEPGGILNGLQLTDKFDVYQKLGKQSGRVFYVPAAYTSNIDPATGFIDCFKKQGITNVQKMKAFFESNFESIHFDKETESFVYKFTYKKEQDGLGKTWEVYSRGTKIVFDKKENKRIACSPTSYLITALNSVNIEYESGRNLLEDILKIQALSHNLKSATFYKNLYRSFVLTTQMRNRTSNFEDYIVSPVKNSNGNFFDSREEAKLGVNAKLPVNADANGAYHIAMKGLFLLKNNFTIDDKSLIGNITNAQWFKFIQDKEYLK